MIPVLKTDRLILTPLRITDAQQTQVLFPHWEIVRYLNAAVPWPYPSDGALTFYRDVALPAMEKGNEWHWTLRLKQDPDFHIGAILLSDELGDNRGFWLGLPWQRQGLMAEAASAVTDFWFGELGRLVLQTRKAVANQASRQLSINMGMRKTGEQQRAFVSGLLPAETWEITSGEWAQRCARSGKH